MDANMHVPDQPDSTDPALVTKLVEELKSQGIFDEIRSECLSEVDSKVFWPSRSKKFTFLRHKPFDFSRLIKTLGFELKALFQDIWENKAPIGSRQQTKLSFETC